ncbi:MAG: hypothetical protein ABIP20_11390 [Chthoniobacteraceae bacterium]
MILHLLAVLWMAASPALHAAAHRDASEPEHTCCVTMFDAGTFHSAPLPVAFSANVVQPLIACVRPISVSLGKIFLVLGVLEHAPPATV